MPDIKVAIIKQADREHYIARWIDPVTGRRKHQTTGETNEKKAWKFANKLEEKLQSGTYKPDSSVSWDAFRKQLWQEYIVSLGKTTQDKYEIVLNSFESFITIKKLSTINASHLSRYQSELRKKGLRELTIKGYLSYMRKALKWAVSQGLLNEVPPINIPKRAKASKVMRGRPITGEEFDRMLKQVPKQVGKKHADSVKYLLNGLWWGGLRIDEALRLTWNHGLFCLIELEGHYYFRIEQEGEKGASDRLLPVAPQFEQMLPNVPPKSGYVFNPTFNRMRTHRPRKDTMSKIISRIGEKAGVITDIRTDKDGNEKKIHATAHDLRRGFGTRWAPLVQPRVLMEMMRHGNIETTMKYYVVGNAQQTSQTLWNVVNSEQSGNKSGNKAQNEPEPEDSQTDESA